MQVREQRQLRLRRCIVEHLNVDLEGSDVARWSLR
jgi:hypothetical protein